MDLSVRKMHQLFKEKYENTVTYNLYRKVFNRDFNLRFGTPRTNTCKVCDQLYAKLVLAKTSEEKDVIENESRLHHVIS